MSLRFLPLAVAGASACAALLVAPAARAADDGDDPPRRVRDPMPAQRGLQLGARFGYSLPLGTVGGKASGLASHVSDLETASVPVGVDVGYRYERRVYFGGTLTFGDGVDPNGTSPCHSSGVSCSRQDWQLRAETRFYFAPDVRGGGWLAVGLGWEVATFSTSIGKSSVTSTLTGPILPDVELGLDIRGGAVAVAPYFGLTFAEFMTHGVSPAAEPVSPWIDARSLHTWVTLGLRGSYGPW
ncbi:MAG TPA: hypothetical protein VIF15_14040 [Polyangiaceae bacterium]